MSDPYLGEIRMFGGNFAPRNWAFCNGEYLTIAEYNALFSLLSTSYGGDGRINFRLPDMRGRVPIHQGLGPGLTQRLIGQMFGAERVIISLNEMPTHNHNLNASKEDAITSSPFGKVLASHSDGDVAYTGEPQDPTRKQNMSSNTIALSGGSEPHYNLMPYQCVSFIICLVGVYPSRN